MTYGTAAHQLYTPEELTSLSNKEHTEIDLKTLLTYVKDGELNIPYVNDKGRMCCGGKDKGLYRNHHIKNGIKPILKEIRPTRNSYVRFNIFKNGSTDVTEKNIKTITEIFIDLDVHDGEVSEDRTHALKKIEQCFIQYFTSGELLQPTRFLNTGRGFALHYQYSEPIPRADKDLLDFHLTTYELLFRRFETFLNTGVFGDLSIEVDRKVKNIGRLGRVAGTLNTKANAYARLVSIGPAYTLADFYNAFHFNHEEFNEVLEGLHKPTKHRKNSTITTEENSYEINLTDTIPETNQLTKNFAKHHLRWLQNYYDMTTWVEGKHRERFLFIWYNCAKILYGGTKAYEMIQALNEGMQEPLPMIQLKYIVEHTDNHTEENPIHGDGIFTFSSRTIMSRRWLDISEEIARDCGCYATKEKREQRKKNKVLGKEREKQVLKLFIWDGLGYKAIQKSLPEEHHCSPNTIKNILKRWGLSPDDRGNKELLSMEEFKELLQDICLDTTEQRNSEAPIGVQKMKYKTTILSLTPCIGQEAKVVKNQYTNKEESNVTANTIDSYTSDELSKKGITEEIVVDSTTKSPSDFDTKSFISPALKSNIFTQTEIESLRTGINHSPKESCKIIKQLLQHHTETDITRLLYEIYKTNCLESDGTEEEKVKQLLRNNKHVFLGGCGGSGKTTLILNWYFNELTEEERDRTCFLSMNGLASSGLPNGRTIHKFFRLPTGVLEPNYGDVLLPKLQEIDRIIIDEIGQVRLDTFATIITLIKVAEVEYNKRIQLIILGDFSQIHPVITKEDYAEFESYYGQKSYAFEFNYWDFLELNKVLLRTSKRQQNKQFAAQLEALRFGQKEAIDYFNTHLDRTENIHATYICPTNKHADYYNQKLVKTFENRQLFVAKIEGVIDSKAIALKYLNLELAEGIRVMTIANTKNYKNGKLGTILKIREKSILVKFDGQEKPVSIKPKVFKQKTGKVTQYPFTYGFAITADKAQGLTLPEVNIVPGYFAAGQLYTAVSRCPEEEKMHLLADIKPEELIVDIYALAQSV